MQPSLSAPTAYYNDIDPNACAWLEQLIELGQIAPGIVDNRSVSDVTPAELKPYTQLHFFAGIGVWSYALRQAGWPDHRPIVTGSCPCQPYSSAGKRKGAGDERDLWWAMFWHICQLRPATVIGEQVASKDGLQWWDTVASDLEAENYAAVAFDLPAAGIGAPHIRQRLFWVANTKGERQCTNKIGSNSRKGKQLEGAKQGGNCFNDGSTNRSIKSHSVGRAYAGQGLQWIYCLDGKKRPSKPSIYPLAYGPPSDLVRGGNTRIQTEETLEAKTMRLKGYGNAIVAPLAAEFIRCVMEVSDVA